MDVDDGAGDYRVECKGEKNSPGAWGSTSAWLIPTALEIVVDVQWWWRLTVDVRTDALCVITRMDRKKEKEVSGHFVPVRQCLACLFARGIDG